jgi:hypothetical protein
MRCGSESAFPFDFSRIAKRNLARSRPASPAQIFPIPFSFDPLFLDIDLRELSFNGCCDGGVFRFSAGAGQGIAGVSGIFYRVPPGLRKYKIILRQVFALCVRQFRHSSTSGLPSSVTGIFWQREVAWLTKIAPPS